MDFSTMPSSPMESWWPYIISLIVGLVTCIRGYLGGTSCPTSTRIDGKIVIVTGASSGVGLETCRELAERGGQIIMCCRSIQRGIEAMNSIKSRLPNANLKLKKLDLTSLKSIREFVECFGDNRLDILINNAGLIFHPYAKTEDGFELHMATNYIGHFLLTHLLLKNLQRSKQGRIISVCAGSYEPANMPLTCEADKKNFVPKEWFGQSKLGLILMTKHLARLLRGTNITINALNPGMVRGTRHLRHSILMRNWTVRISIAPWFWLFMKSPKQGAQTSIYLATDPSVATKSGEFFSDCTEETTISKSDDPEIARVLYDRTCSILNEAPYKKT
ncbi:retinol dehydrogenase 12-like [Arctopsyche grandis]|uniref:retinol dehydrogenase 12-like n=1 Tax=Arctopsyche grandis TaxID=121162 RepID=UPI00406D7982